MKKTTYLYIFKETLPIFSIGLIIFTVILLMDKIFKLVELIVNVGCSISNVLKLLIFISPSFLVFTILVAVLLATLLTFGRLSADNEITAFKASGMSLYQLFLPIVIFSFLAYLLTSFIVFYGLPWGNRGFISTLYSIAKAKADIEIKEKVFNVDFDGLVIYVDQVPIKEKRMEGILIYDERNKEYPCTIFAKDALLINNHKSQEVFLRLCNGNIHRFEPKSNIFQKVQFDTYDIRLELSKLFVVFEKKIKEHEMSIDDIKEKIAEWEKIGKDTTSLKVELHRRYAIPFVCIIFGFIGVPLGIQSRRSGRSFGFVFSILILLIYYFSLIAFEMFAMRKTIPPFLAAWTPNFFFGAFGVYLLIKVANESPFKPAVWLTEAFDLLRKK